MAKHVYLRKFNDDFVSHCQCAKEDALISAPGQMDCPWCGCGWLFICGRCRKAFTFAEGIETDEPWTKLGHHNLRVLYQREPESGEVEEWVEFMKILLKDVVPGENYVYLDGYVISTMAQRIEIEGWHSNHDLEFVPQVVGLIDAEIRDRLLSSRDYWLANRVEQTEE